MINKELELTIQATIKDAMAKRHEYLTLEHLLLAILHNDYGMEVIRNCGGNIQKLRDSLNKAIEKNVPLLPSERNNPPQISIAVQRVIERAMLHCESAGKKEVHAGDLIASILLEEDSYASFLLES